MLRLGIKPALNHDTLWFVFEEPIFGAGLHSPLTPDSVVPQSIPTKAHAFTERVLQLGGIRNVAVRPSYVALTVTDEKNWRRLLPTIMDLVSFSLGQSETLIYPHPPNNPEVPEWHISLLYELFPPEAFACPRLCSDCPLVPQGATADVERIEPEMIQAYGRFNTMGDAPGLSRRLYGAARILMAITSSTNPRVAIGSHYSPLVSLRGTSIEDLPNAIRLCQGHRRRTLWQWLFRLDAHCGCMKLWE